MRHISKAIVVLFAASAVFACKAGTIAEWTVTFLGVTAGSTQTLSDVTLLLGASTAWHSGDAGLAETRVCYRSAGNGGETIVVFASNSEMSDPKGQVTSIRIYGKEIPFAAKRRCAKLTRSDSVLRTLDGLHIGSTKTEITGALWVRPLSKRNSFHYDSCVKKYMRKSDPYFERWLGRRECFEDSQQPYVTDCTTAEFQLKGDAAVYIELSRGQSVC